MGILCAIVIVAAFVAVTIGMIYDAVTFIREVFME